jgi:hypothetical protein
MRINKKAAAVAAAAVALTGTGVAYAWWSTTGTGSGSATTGTSTPFEVTADNAENGDLTPGGPSDTIHYTVHNPSTGHQHISSIVISVAETDADGAATTFSSGSAPACTLADFGLGGQTVSGSYTVTLPSGGVDLAPENASTDDDYTGTVALQMLNLNSNQDSCKSVTVPLHFAVS